MKFDAECNEIIAEIVLYRFHEDYESLTNDIKQIARDIPKLQVRQKSRTDMESATFETLETAVVISLAFCFMAENRRNVTFLQQSRCPPLFPFWGSPNPSREESASHHLTPHVCPIRILSQSDLTA